MGIGQPRVERDQPCLGAIPEQQQAGGQAGDGGVEPGGVRQQHLDVQGVAAGGAGMEAGEVEEHGPQERQGDTDRADDDVLPGGLECGAGPAVADQERGGHSGCLDGHPHHSDVVGQDRACHRGEEDRDEHAIQVRALAVGMPVGELGVDVADAGPGGQRAHGADDDEHGDAERVHPEQVQHGEPRPRPGVQAQDGAADQDQQGSQDRHRRGEPSPAQDECKGGRGHRGGDGHQKEECHQPRSSVSWSRSVSPKVRRM